MSSDSGYTGDCDKCFWSYQSGDWKSMHTRNKKDVHCLQHIHNRAGTTACSGYEPRLSALKKAILKMRGE